MPPAQDLVPRQVPRLTAAQIAALKRDGYLVLPGALDLRLCAAVRDSMWEDLSAIIPRLRQHDRRSWTPFTDDEAARLAEGLHPKLELQGSHRFFLRNGVDESLLDLFPRALFDVAEQLLGEGEVVYPRGRVDGVVSGPCFMDALTEATLQNPYPYGRGSAPRWPPP